jgi:hypothetical protein
MEMEIQPQQLSVDYQTISNGYHDNFEKAFVMNPTTSKLSCIDEEIEAWYNSQIEFICVFIGFMPSALHLTQALPLDRSNQLNQAYTFAYIAYRKQNNLFGKINDPMYTPALFVE